MFLKFINRLIKHSHKWKHQVTRNFVIRWCECKKMQISHASNVWEDVEDEYNPLKKKRKES